METPQRAETRAGEEPDSCCLGRLSPHRNERDRWDVTERKDLGESPELDDVGESLVFDALRKGMMLRRMGLRRCEEDGDAGGISGSGNKSGSTTYIGGSKSVRTRYWSMPCVLEDLKHQLYIQS